MFHANTKHIDVKYHFICKIIEDKHIQLIKVQTKEKLVKLLTKGLLGEIFVYCFELMGIGQMAILLIFVERICMDVQILKMPHQEVVGVGGSWSGLDTPNNSLTHSM